MNERTKNASKQQENWINEKKIRNFPFLRAFQCIEIINSLSAAFYFYLSFADSEESATEMIAFNCTVDVAVSVFFFVLRVWIVLNEQSTGFINTLFVMQSFVHKSNNNRWTLFAVRFTFEIWY